MSIWYLDWPFWTVIVVIVAIIFSQIPPVRILIKKAKIDFDLYSKIAITHKIGNPNLQLHLIVNNIGGRKIKIKAIETILEKNGQELAKLPAQNYLQTQTDQNTLLFTQFSLKPEEEWAHIVNLLNFFDRDQEREFLKHERNMKSDLQAKRKQFNEEPRDFIELDPSVILPFDNLFDKYFIWRAGEYIMTVNIITDYPNANLAKKYRFTIFESQEEQLKDIATDWFKYGGGILWDPKIQTNVIFEIKEI